VATEDAMRTSPMLLTLVASLLAPAPGFDPARGPARAGRVVLAVAYTTVQIETWTYDLGPDRFITIATLQDGKVTAVEHGGYGYRR
jgi:hypothetical protein